MVGRARFERATIALKEGLSIESLRRPLKEVSAKLENERSRETKNIINKKI